MTLPKNTARWLGSYAVGLLADQAYYLSLSWYAAALTPDPVVVGAIMGIGSLPRAMLLLPGGMLADRFGSKRVAMISSALKAAVIIVACLSAAHFGTETVTGLAVTAILIGAFDAVFLPAIQSMPWAVAEPSRVPMVQKQFSVVQRCGVVLGPALAGLMLAQWPIALVYGAIGACFALSTIALNSVTAKTGSNDPGTSPRKGTLRTLVELMKNRPCRAMLALVAISELVCSGAFSTGITLLVDFHGWGAEAMGALVTAYGAGSAAGAAASLASKHRHALGSTVAICAAVMGAMLYAVAAAPSPELAAAGIALSGAAAGAASTFLTASYLGSVEPGEGARSMAVLSLASFGTASLSSFLCGAIAQVWGAAAIFSALGLALIVIAAWAARCPDLRFAA
ncbi:MFS transporter [Atopobiaceae bacterium 24-176]